MNSVEFMRIIIASAILGLLMLSSSGIMFGTYFLIGFYVLLSTLIFLGITMIVADYKINKPVKATSKASTFLMQCLHMVVISHLYLLGFTNLALPIITILAISMLANLIEKRNPT